MKAEATLSSIRLSAQALSTNDRCKVDALMSSTDLNLVRVGPAFAIINVRTTALHSALAKRAAVAWSCSVQALRTQVQSWVTKLVSLHLHATESRPKQVVGLLQAKAQAAKRRNRKVHSMLWSAGFVNRKP